MNAVPPSFTAAGGDSAAEATGLRWTALAEAAGLVAALAGIDSGEAAEPPDFAALVRRADSWRRGRAEQGLADIAAIMEPGLAALLAVNARGADPRPAARALWREFAAARAALVALVVPDLALA